MYIHITIKKETFTVAYPRMKAQKVNYPTGCASNQEHWLDNNHIVKLWMWYNHYDTISNGMYTIKCILSYTVLSDSERMRPPTITVKIIQILMTASWQAFLWSSSLGHSWKTRFVSWFQYMPILYRFAGLFFSHFDWESRNNEIKRNVSCG